MKIMSQKLDIHAHFVCRGHEECLTKSPIMKQLLLVLREYIPHDLGLMCLSCNYVL